MNSKQTYTILEIKLKESIDEQTRLQSIDLNEVMKETLAIRELRDALNECIDDDPSVFATS